MESTCPLDRQIVERFSLQDKVAIVTGGGKGIGRAIAHAFAMDGAKLVIAEMDADSCRQAVESYRNLSAEETAAGRIRNRIGDTSMQQMKARNSGNIINIVSSAGLRPYPGQPPYGAAKAALIHFTQSMVVQLAPYNIRVNAIAPGTIVTASAAYLGDRDENARKRGTPLDRAGRVEDITPAVIFLASEASKYITGVTIEATGGPPFSAFFLEEAKREWAAAKKKIEKERMQEALNVPASP